LSTHNEKNEGISLLKRLFFSFYPLTKVFLTPGNHMTIQASGQVLSSFELCTACSDRGQS
jgi:hypothetical protein